MEKDPHSSIIPATLPASDTQRLLFTSGSRGWLIPYTAGRFIAMPLTACQEIVEQPEVMRVPGSTTYTCGLISWHREWLALIDFDCLINNKTRNPGTEITHALVIAWQGTDGNMAYGALALSTLPRMIAVQEEDFCPLPASNPLWPQLAISCFRHQGKAVPIIDAAKLFLYQGT